MKTYRVKYGSPKNVTNPGDDSKSYLFPCSVVDTNLIGKPEEEISTRHSRVTVTIQNNRLAGWHLSDNDLIKILWEVGRRELKEKIELGEAGSILSVNVNTETHRGKCPFDPARIPDPKTVEDMIEERRKIGF